MYGGAGKRLLQQISMRRMTPIDNHLVLPGGDRTRHPVSTIPSRTADAEVVSETAREILTRATGFMDAYDFTLNPYSGCFFGCTYCYAAFFSTTKEQRDSWGQWVTVKEKCRRIAGAAKARVSRRQAHLYEQRHRPISTCRAQAEANSPPAGHHGRAAQAQAGGADPQSRRGARLRSVQADRSGRPRTFLGMSQRKAVGCR